MIIKTELSLTETKGKFFFLKKSFRLKEKSSDSNISIRFVKYLHTFLQGNFEQLLMSFILHLRDPTPSPQIF